MISFGFTSGSLYSDIYIYDPFHSENLDMAKTLDKDPLFLGDGGKVDDL